MEDKLLQERAQLLDPTPLFFPTEWNYGQQPLRESTRKHPGHVFGSFPPKQSINEESIANYGAEIPVVPEKLADVLGVGNEAPFAGFGRIDWPLSTLPIRSAYLQISDLGSGQDIVGQPLSGLVLPRSEFTPVEFLVIVESVGMIAEPILSIGSGWDDVDVFFRNYLIKAYRIGERLPPGRYRVVVGA